MLEQLLAASSLAHPSTIQLPTGSEFFQFPIVPIYSCPTGTQAQRVIGWRSRGTLGAGPSVFITRSRGGIQILGSGRSGQLFELVYRAEAGLFTFSVDQAERARAAVPSGFCLLESSRADLGDLAEALSALSATLAAPASISHPLNVTTVTQMRMVILSTPEFVTHAGSDWEGKRDALLVEASAIIERDTSISFCMMDLAQPILTAEEMQKISTPTTELSQLVEVNRAIATHAGTAAYDLGHLLDWSPGERSVGTALPGTICGPGKGVARTRMISPADDYVTLAHEISHQLGAEHSFNGKQGKARVQGSGVEPGSGSTLMSYAGAWVGSPELQPSRDLYLHAGSVAQIRQRVEEARAVSGTCGKIVSTTSAPILKTQSGIWHVPPMAFLSLDVTASDPEKSAVDVRWDEIDPGESPDSRPPYFRSFVKRSLPRRVPRDEERLADFIQLSESRPGANQSYQFRAVGRDGTGGISSADVTVKVIDGDPFAVVEPKSGDTWPKGGKAFVWWQSGSATDPRVGAKELDIILVSRKQDLTFEEDLLKEGVALTDCSEEMTNCSVEVKVPNRFHDWAVIRVLAKGQSFFAESKPFKIE